jgi:hypothetical protein
MFLNLAPMNTTNAIAKDSHHTFVVGKRTRKTPQKEERNILRISARKLASQLGFRLKANSCAGACKRRCCSARICLPPNTWVHQSVCDIQRLKIGRRKDTSGLLPMAMSNARCFAARRWTTSRFCTWHLTGSISMSVCCTGE